MIKHPSSYINIDIQQQLKKHIEAAEVAGQLHPEQLRIITEQNWFNLFVPKQYSGLECSLPEALHLQEALAYIDGSIGWTVTLCSGANMFIGFMPESAATEIFSSSVCLAGSGQATGVAIKNNNGFTITGSWHYATGALHADYFTANCQVEGGGTLLKNNDGLPNIQSFWFKRSEVELIKGWNSMGMVATGSHSFTVNKIQVPHNRMFNLQGADAILPQPIYRFPFLQFAEVTLAVNLAGMCRGFIDAALQLMETKYPEPTNSKGLYFAHKIEDASRQLENIRSHFYLIVAKAYDELTLTGKVIPLLLQQVSETSRLLAKNAREIVDGLYPYCGLVAANPQTELNRIWRNFHTATQHTLLNYPPQ